MKSLTSKSPLTFGLRLLAIAAVGASLTVSMTASQTTLAGQEGADDFDRLDGTGATGKRVDVIEWEGNLEIHVYPAGSLASLDLKIDDQTNKDKKVMVIGYHFKEAPKVALVRRAILGVPFYKGFKAFRDKTETEFDKIVISNNTLAGDGIVAYGYGEPSQLYPDGHPMLAQKSDGTSRDRVPASTAKKSSQEPKPEEETKRNYDEDGGIRPFFMNGK